MSSRLFQATSFGRSRWNSSLSAVGLLTLSLTILAGPVAAKTSSFWISRSVSDYQNAELDGVVLDPDGSLRVGVDSKWIELPGADVAWTVLPTADGVLIGTGHEGLLYRASGNSAEIADSTHTGQILCLVEGEDGEVYVGTGPEGKIFRLGRDGLELFYETDDHYVWSLAWSGGKLFAATGPEGHLIQIDSDGEGRLVYRATEGHLSALAADGAGGVFVGSSGKSRVLHHSQNRTRVLFEAPAVEIRSLVWDGRAVFAAALHLNPTRVEPATDESPESVTPAPRSPTTPRGTVYRIVPDSLVTAWWSIPQGMLFALAQGPRGEVIVATGDRGGIYSLDSRGNARVLFLAEQGEFTSLASTQDEIWAVTSNPTRLYRLASRPSQAEVRSDVLDASRLSQWGRLTAHGSGLQNISFSTRSGNTEIPDSTWSEWEAGSNGRVVASPRARFLQWRARLSGSSQLDELWIAFVDVNQPPRISAFTLYPTPGQFYTGEISPRQEPVTQILSNGQRVQFSMQNPSPRTREMLPTWARGLRPLTWEATDPNQDPLLYTLEYRKLGTEDWIEIASNLVASGHTWDASGVSEGFYELRLTASDSKERGTEGLEDQLVSEQIRIDLTPPTLALTSITVDGNTVVIEGNAADEALFVSQVEVSIDGSGAWIPASPKDGLFDGPRERFVARLENLSPGTHPVSIRVIDAAGNASSKTEPVKILP